MNIDVEPSRYTAVSIDRADSRIIEGRLVLDAQAVHFIHIDERRSGTLAGKFAAKAVDQEFGIKVDQVGVELDGEAGAIGRELSESVRGLPPAEQVAAVHGSFSLAVKDTEVLKLSILNKLIVVTESRGDRFAFSVPGRFRKPVKKWLADVRKQLGR